VRRREQGANSMQEKEKESILKEYLEKFTEPLILLLLASAFISIIIGQYDDAFSIILAVIIVSTVGFIQEHQSEKSVQALTQFVSHKCHVIRDGQEREVLAEDLVQGDIVLLTRGNRVPADMRLIESLELRIDESLLTGESHPVSKYDKVENFPRNF
jgi:Ca2+-transporting ATPase